jgi:hypothetical protein
MAGFDVSRHRWREVAGEPGDSYRVHHWYTILGHDQGAGTLDMIVRWSGDGGHCNIHRHMATTSVLVLEGEQHLFDYDEAGRLATEPRIRRVGDYGLSVGAEAPHRERGGPEGGLVYFGTHSDDGVLYEVLDEDLNLVIPVTIELLVSDFNQLAV